MIVGSHKFTVITMSLLSIFLIASLIPNAALIYNEPWDWKALLHVANVFLLLSWSWYSISVYLECQREKGMKELAQEEVRRLQAEIMEASFLANKTKGK